MLFKLKPMKLNYLVLSIAAVLSVSSFSGLPTTSPVQAAQVATVKSGNFIAAEHPTEGTARIITENGRRYLEFDQAFMSDMGPDLYVILHRAASLPKGGLKEQDYISLGRLQKLNGPQRYTIPQDISLADYRSVAIWCRQFNATFGYAPLQTAAQANR
jgi:hypothetical protein